MIKVSKEVMAKLIQMKEQMNMPITQCINYLVTEWLKNNKVS